MPEPKRLLKVFLCHAHSDKDAVRALYARLTQDGVDAWLDKEKLLPGQDWELEIRKAVREADVVVVCLSKQFNQAGFRQKEVRLALDTAMEKPEGEIFIIPARLEECDSLESLRKWHWVDLFEEDGYERLTNALRARANRIGVTLHQPSELIMVGVKDNLKPRRVELILDGEFSAFDSHRQSETINILATLLRINPSDIRILKVYQSSIGIIIELPDNAAIRLYELAVTHDIRLVSLGAKSVLVENKERVILSNTISESVVNDIEKLYKNEVPLKIEIGLIIDGAKDSDSVYAFDLIEFVENLQRNANVTIYILGRAQRNSVSGQAPPKNKPLISRPRLIGPILERSGTNMVFIVIAAGKILDLEDFATPEWEHRLLLIWRSDDYVQPWQHNYILRLGDSMNVLWDDILSYIYMKR